jgi:hypothetical protein
MVDHAAVTDRQAVARKRTPATLLRKIAEGTWICGDPGMQFDTTIHKWHTCKGTAPSTPPTRAREYMFLDDTACNLASLNLMKFKREPTAVRRRTLQGRRAHLHHRPGNPGGQRQLPHQGDRREQPHLPHARPRLRQPRRAHHELRPPYDSDEGRASPAPSPPS